MPSWGTNIFGCGLPSRMNRRESHCGGKVASPEIIGQNALYERFMKTSRVIFLRSMCANAIIKQIRIRKLPQRNLLSSFSACCSLRDYFDFALRG